MKLTNILMSTLRSMTTRRTKTLGQTSEEARHANDEKISPPLEVSPIRRCPRSVDLPLTH